MLRSDPHKVHMGRKSNLSEARLRSRASSSHKNVHTSYQIYHIWKLVPCTAAGILIKFTGLPGKTGTLAGCGHHIGNSWAVIGVRRMGVWWLVTLHSAQVKWQREMIRSGWTPVTNGRYYNGATWPDRTAYLQTTVLNSGIPKLTMLVWRNEHKGCPFVQEVSTNDRTAQTRERKQIKETTSRYVKCFKNMDIIGQAPGR